MRVPVRGLIAGLLLSLAGCAKPAPARPAPVPTIAGQWRSHSGRRVLDMILSLRGGSVTGDAELRDPIGETVHLVVRGEYTPPAVHLRFFARDRMLMTYLARLDLSDTLRGVLEDAATRTDSLFFFRLLDEFQ